MKRRIGDLTGKRFGRLVVLTKDDQKSSSRRSYWMCICDCGQTKSVLNHSLVCGDSQSCGCLRREVLARQHVRSSSLCSAAALATKSVWRGMIARCKYPRNSGYRNYGARGIKVCERWTLFENFLSDMGERPSEQHSIERLDANADYCPGNCVWATRQEQANNKRNTRWVLVDGKRMSLAQACRLLNKNYRAVKDRINGLKWSAEEALEIVPRRGKWNRERVSGMH